MGDLPTTFLRATDDLIVRREVGAPLAQTLDAIRDDLREWRESIIPQELRNFGVVRVIGSASNGRFRMFLSGDEVGDGGVCLQGDALRTSTGTLIVARVERCPRDSPLRGLFFFATVVSFVINSWVGLAVVLLHLPAVAIRYHQRGWFPNWAESRARYLVARLDGALAKAGTVTAIETDASNARRDLISKH